MRYDTIPQFGYYKHFFTYIYILLHSWGNSLEISRFSDSPWDLEARVDSQYRESWKVCQKTEACWKLNWRHHFVCCIFHLKSGAFFEQDWWPIGRFCPTFPSCTITLFGQMDVKLLKSRWNFKERKTTTPDNNIYTLWKLLLILCHSFFDVRFIAHATSLFPIQTLILRLGHLRFEQALASVSINSLANSKWVIDQS